MCPCCKRLIVVFGLTLVFGRVGQAQVVSLKKQAAQIAVQGVRLFKAKNYQGAVEQFMAASKLDPTNPIYVWNIARCFEELGKPALAIKYFARFEEIDPKNAQKAEARINRIIHTELAVVTIDVTPKEAKVQIDGILPRPYKGGYIVVPGHHRVVISHEGYGNFVKEVDLKPGDVLKLVVVLKSTIPGYLTIKLPGSVSYSEVKLDGKLLYTGSLPKTLEVPAGRHTVYVGRALGFRPFKGEVVVKPGEYRTIELEEATIKEEAVSLKKTSKVKHSKARKILKQVLLYSGIGLGLVGGGLHLWGYLQQRKISDDMYYYEARDLKNSAQWKFYTAYGLYGAAAVCILTGVLLPNKSDSGPRAFVNSGKSGLQVGFFGRF